jgi:transcriptional regulator of acetoin/glycerol metabolism
VAEKDLGLPETASRTAADSGPAPRTKDELKRIKKKIRSSAVDEVEKDFLLRALSKADWNISRAAKETGLQRTNFQKLIKKHGISAKRPQESSPPEPDSETE